MKGNKGAERAWWMRVENVLESMFGADIAQWPRLWHSTLNHCRQWPLPPRWSAADWAREIEGEAVLAVFQARESFDPQRGVVWPTFVKWRIRDALLIRYRREYYFGRSCPDELPADLPSNADEDETAAEAQLCTLSVAWAQLTSDERELLRLLYEEDETEASVAVQWEVSQQAVSRRKSKILRKLWHLMKKFS